MFENFEHHRIAVNSVEIACVTSPAPQNNASLRPALLLLHGFPQTKTMWAKIAPELAQNFQVVCADLRGYGDSSKPACLPDASNYSFRAMAQDQVALMRSLGHTQFHLVGHDRGARVAHRLALDHPQAVRSLTVMDIVPTYTVFLKTDRRLAGAYWHWFLLSQPAPFPERLIEANPDFFYETCLAGWGAAKLCDFDPEQLADYRRAWRNPEMIQASCGDYRAAASLDLAHDEADLSSQVSAPSLVLYGQQGVMHKLFDIAKEWRPKLTRMQAAAMPGGHFFPDQFPKETAQTINEFALSVNH